MKTTSAAPDFTHAPGFASRYSMIAYGSGPSIEYTLPGRTEQTALSQAHIEARWAFQPCVILRSPDGLIVYQGDVL